VITATDDAAAEFLASAERAVAGAAGACVLDDLGWWELLDGVGETELRLALFSVFRAQGRRLSDTPALGALIAHPYDVALGRAPGSTVAALTYASPRSGEVALVLGDTGSRDLLIDLPDRPVAIYEAAALARTRALPGRLTVREVDLSEPSRLVDLSDEDRRSLRIRAQAMGRVAAAAEILGAAEGAVRLAVEHARVRAQFGQPIGSFQAVRHLLAWAETDCVALAAVVRQAVWGLAQLPDGYAETAKALAGRNGRRACERSLQVLGGIGFTAEHDHHHHHSRVLVLDALLGTSTVLTRRLGARIRETGQPAAFTGHALDLGRLDRSR